MESGPPIFFAYFFFLVHVADMDSAVVSRPCISDAFTLFLLEDYPRCVSAFFAHWVFTPSGLNSTSLSATMVLG